LTAGLIASVFALAGPTWQKNELPAFKAQDPTVVVLSLAQSMNATDVSPNRLARAVHKVRDVLGRARGGDFGLIIYSDRPFVAAPLTNDTRVITQMLPELSTNLMPVIGNRLDLAIDKAKGLLDRVEARNGRIVVIADDAGSDPDASIASARAANKSGYRVNVLGVGTRQGATMQTASGHTIKTRDGQQAITRLTEAELGKIADTGGGVFVTLTPGSEDVDAVLHNSDSTPAGARETSSDFRADAWNDMGYWLLIIPLLLAPLAFRKNVLMALPIGVAIALCAPAPDAMAATPNIALDNLWRTPDQQGANTYQRGDFEAAAVEFENPDWKASALYKAGQYDEAAALYQNTGTADGDYNMGNALAKAGALEQALGAYDRALKQHPEDGDIQFNRDLVAKLLEQHKRKEQKQQDKQQQGGGQSQSQSGGEQSQGQSGGEQSQGQSGGEQSQAQSGGEQSQAQSGGEQSQAQSGGEQSQAQSGGEQSQAQSGGEQSQAQSGGEQSQGQSGGEQSQAQSGGEPNQAQAAGERQDGSQDHPSKNGNVRTAQSNETQHDSDGQGGTAQNMAKADPSNADEGGKDAFQRAMDALLEGNGGGRDKDDAPQPEQSPSGTGLSELDQAREQQLRAVPDDPSGLLRARIRQYYSRQVPNG
jgi:Ca-activated chloride channel family protein